MTYWRACRDFGAMDAAADSPITGPDGRVYVARVLRFEAPGRQGEWARVSVAVSTDQKTWRDLPMKLVWWERLRNGLFTTWPPESFDRLFFADGQLCLEYRDQWSPYDRRVLPLKLDVESLGCAEYLSRHGWKLKRIRHMDYRGADKPP